MKMDVDEMVADDYNFIITPRTEEGDCLRDADLLIQAELENIKEECTIDENLEIKVEHDEDVGVDVLNAEVNSQSEDAGAKIQSDEEEKIDVCLVSRPIVFTTRLDDMHIIRQTDDCMSINDITKHILKESAPKYNNQKLTKKPCSRASYQALKRKINKINKIALKKSFSDETSPIGSTNSMTKLIKMCKSVTVVVDKLLNFDEIGNSSKVTKDAKAKPLLENKKIEHFEKKTTYCFIFQDYSIKETDLYCINNSKITENYTIKNIEDINIDPYIYEYRKTGILPRKVKFCCWQKRKDFIDALEPLVFNLHVKHFMKKPHCCRPNHCTCCCRDLKEKDNNDANAIQVVLEKYTKSKHEKTENVEINALEKQISDTFLQTNYNTFEYGYKTDWRDNLLRVKDSIANEMLVTTALSYTRSPRKFTNNIDINVETYEWKGMGKLVAYSNKNTNSELAPVNELASSLEDSCCWYGREKNISNLRFKSNLERFIKSPHNCLPDKCTCCCKPQKILSPLINIISVPNRSVPIYTDLTKKRSIQTKTNAKFVETCPVLSAKPDKNRMISQLPTISIPQPGSSHLAFQKATKNLPQSLPLKVPKTSSVTKQFMKKKRNDIGIQRHHDVIVPQQTTVPKVASNKSYSNLPTPSSDIVQIDNNTKDLADSLITTILDRFKDVRLTINEDGNVAAALNAPAHTLNTAELKILANILAHAQNQVQVLGLGPGSILKSVSKETQTNTPGIQARSCDLQVSSEEIPSKDTGPKINDIHPKPEVLRSFSAISQDHSQLLKQSFSSYVKCTEKQRGNEMVSLVDDIDDTSCFPKISSVFSLQNPEKSKVGECVKTCAQGAWSNSEKSGKNPEKCTVREYVKTSARGAWSNSEKSSNVKLLKRKSDSQFQPAGKIRVVAPDKLGIPNAAFVDTTENDKSQGNLCIDNLLKPNLMLNVNATPSTSHEIMGNAVTIPETSAGTISENNTFVIHSLHSGIPAAAKNTGNVINMNAVFKNMQVMPQPTSATVFHINNLDKKAVAKPRLLNAEPVQSPKSHPQATERPPPLVRLAPKPCGPSDMKLCDFWVNN